MNIERPLPKRLHIIKSLQEVLEQISTIDGDSQTLKGKVYRNRSLLGVEVAGTVPCLSIIEAPRPDYATFAGEENTMRRDQWTILVQGIVGDDKTDNTGDDAYFLCQDVERRLQRIMATKAGTGNPQYPETYLLGGKITSVEVAPPIVRPPEAEVSRYAFFYIAVRLGVALQVGE